MLERHRYSPLLAILTAVVLCALAQVGPFKPDPFTRSTVNDPYALENRQRAEIDYDPYEHARYACRETVRQSLDDPDALLTRSLTTMPTWRSRKRTARGFI